MHPEDAPDLLNFVNFNKIWWFMLLLSLFVLRMLYC